MKGSLAASAVAWLEAVKWRRKVLEDNVDCFICPSEFMNAKMQQGGFNSDKLVTLCNFVAPEMIDAYRKCEDVYKRQGLAWYLTSRYGPKFVRRHTELMKSQLVEDGYIGVDTSMREYVGHEAEAATDMRPGGKIIIHNQEFDAVSERGYIAEGTHVIVTRFENAQLYVCLLYTSRCV